MGALKTRMKDKLKRQKSVLINSQCSAACPTCHGRCSQPAGHQGAHTYSNNHTNMEEKT